MDGPGKYGELAQLALKHSQAESLVLIVIDGTNGSGLSCASRDPQFDAKVPALLRFMADQIEREVKSRMN